MQLPVFNVGGSALDSLDLKVTLLRHGICIPNAVYDALEPKYRLSRRPHSCNTLFLGDNVPVYIAQNNTSPFRLSLEDDKPTLTHNGETVTQITLPPKSRFYAQRTRNGNYFGNLAVLQGADMLAFSHLWSCELAKTNYQCLFCHSGNYTAQLVEAKQWSDPEFVINDIVDAIQYAVEEDPKTRVLQLTAGSTFDPDSEIDRYARLLREIEKRIGLQNVGCTILYLTPPKDLNRLDALFEAGDVHLAFDLDLWDEALFERYCPGKAKFTTRQRHWEALSYAAKKYGPNRICSVFVAGLEPLESLLAGETVLAECGIVPLPSPLLSVNIENPALPSPPGLDYYRTLRHETAALYRKHRLVVPGTAGSSVCLSRDIWLRREIL